MTDLTEQKCVPCEGGIPPLERKKEEEYIKEVEGWSLEREGIHHIRKEFYFDNFVQSIEFVNKVSDIAEKEGHHPNIYIYYDEVVLEIYTHAIKGLHKNDFILAAKIDNI
jgi:4a-hydroxytetrahydrobiopterin dehydratase